MGLSVLLFPLHMVAVAVAARYPRWGGEGRMTSITHLGFAIRLPLTVSRFSVFLILIALLDSNERASEQNELLFYLMMPPQHLSWRDVCPASLKYFF